MNKEFQELTNQIKTEIMNKISELQHIFQREIDRNISDLDTVDLAITYAAFKNTLDDISHQTEQLDASFKSLKTEDLPKLYKLRHVKTVPVQDLGFSVGYVTKFFASFPKSKEQEAFSYLRENGLRHIIKPTVNVKTLTSSLKEVYEKYGEDKIPTNIFNIGFADTTSLRKLSQPKKLNLGHNSGSMEYLDLDDEIPF